MILEDLISCSLFVLLCNDILWVDGFRRKAMVDLLFKYFIGFYCVNLLPMNVSHMETI